MDVPLSSPVARPRLTPGVPAGGIVALAVTAAIVGWGLAVGGDGGSDGPRTATLRISGDLSLAPEAPPVPPAPPAPPAPPSPPSVLQRGPGVVVIDPAQIARSVEDALRTVDVEAVRRSAEAARQHAEHLRQQVQSGDWEQVAREAQARGLAKIERVERAPGEDRLAASFTAPAGVRLVDVRGDVSVEVSSRAEKIRVEVEDGASALRTDVADGALTLVGTGSQGRPVDVRLTLPEGADVTLANFFGDFSLSGREAGRVTVELRHGDVSLERVAAADVRVIESGSVSINRVEKSLTFVNKGACDLSVERAGSAAVEVVGSSSVNINRVENGLTLALPGHAEVDVERVDGPLKTAFTGVGRVSIGGGDAKPFQVAVMGSGDFTFGGTAYDPVILNGGTGSIHVERHSGEPRIQRLGTGSVVLGAD